MMENSYSSETSLGIFLSCAFFLLPLLKVPAFVIIAKRCYIRKGYLILLIYALLTASSFFLLLQVELLTKQCPW